MDRRDSGCCINLNKTSKTRNKQRPPSINSTRGRRIAIIVFLHVDGSICLIFAAQVNYKAGKRTEKTNPRMTNTQRQFMAALGLAQIGKGTWIEPAVPVLESIAKDLQNDRYLRAYALEALRRADTIQVCRIGVVLCCMY